MPLDKKNVDQLFAEPYPPFLEQLKTDPQAALDEFSRYAGQWLIAHPSPSMKPLTPDEQQDVVEETIKRCVAKEGAPLLNYTDMWGNFGKWLENVAEQTCIAKHEKIEAKPKPAADGPAAPAPAPAAAAKPAESPGPSPAARPAESPAASPTAKPAAAPARKEPPDPAATPPHLRKPPAEERPTHAMHAFYKWIRSPVVFVPLAIVVAVIVVRAIQTSGGGAQSSRTATTGPIDIVLLTDEESRAPQYDLLELDGLSPSAENNEQVSMTAVFRSGRLTVLRMATEGLPEDAYPDRIVVENEAGEIAWDSQIDPEAIAEGSINLRIDPYTIVPGEYTIRVLSHTGAPIARAVIAIVAQ